MVDRHVLRDRGILPAASIKTFVAADPIPFVINLNAALGVPDIHFLAHILIRDRIVLKIYGNVCKQPLSADSRAAFPGQSGPY